MLERFLNIPDMPHILVYQHYHLIQKFPSSVVVDSHLSFGDQCSLFNVDLPDYCNYALFFFHGFTIEVKDNGEFQFIIINYKHYEQNSKT